MKKLTATPTAISALLRAALKRKVASKPGYSMRALARDLGVSPAFVSQMMSGKRRPPRRSLEKLFYTFELDLHEREMLTHAALNDIFGDLRAVDAPGKNKRKLATRDITESNNKNLLSHWENLAVLEGATLSPPLNESENLRKRLGLTAAQFGRAKKTLLEEKLIVETEGEIQKQNEHLYIAGGRTKKEIRTFHEMMIEKGKQELIKKTSEEDYQRRLINGFTMALHHGQVEKLKLKILDFLDEFSREASNADCTDVYQFNLQFFPLTAKSEG